MYIIWYVPAFPLSSKKEWSGNIWNIVKPPEAGPVSLRARFAIKIKGTFNSGIIHLTDYQSSFLFIENI